ncbi:hypothetical protein MC885_009946, partial [Smutsia gigantea]
SFAVSERSLNCPKSYNNRLVVAAPKNCGLFASEDVKLRAKKNSHFTLCLAPRGTWQIPVDSHEFQLCSSPNTPPQKSTTGTDRDLGISGEPVRIFTELESWI